jgi:hypothetical protein
MVDLLRKSCTHAIRVRARAKLIPRRRRREDPAGEFRPSGMRKRPASAAAVSLRWFMEDTRRSPPQASTWATMVVGFAGLGYAGFRGRKTSVSIV